MITDFCKFQRMQNFLFILLFLLSCSESNDSAAGPNGSNVSCDDPMLFMLEDLNTTSSTYGESVGPETWANQIRLFYFTNNEQ